MILAWASPFKAIAMIVLDGLSYFNRNKQNSYAALSDWNKLYTSEP